MPSRDALARLLRTTLGWDPLIFGALALAIFVVTLLLGWQLSGETDPERRRVFDSTTVADDAPEADIAGVISETDGTTLTVRDADGPIDVTVPDSALLQLLTPIELADVAVGDLVIVGGIDEDVRNFIIEGIVVLDPSEAAP